MQWKTSLICMRSLACKLNQWHFRLLLSERSCSPLHSPLKRKLAISWCSWIHKIYTKASFSSTRDFNRSIILLQVLMMTHPWFKVVVWASKVSLNSLVPPILWWTRCSRLLMNIKMTPFSLKLLLRVRLRALDKELILSSSSRHRAQ